MTEKTLFSKIIDREIPAEIVFEDDLCIGIRDVNPQAPLHVLVIPKKPIAKISEGDAGDAALLGHLLLSASDIARAEGFADFRLVINNGAAAGQSVFHVHVHVLAGRGLAWPPG